MCVAVITCHENRFSFDKSDSKDGERLKSGSSFFGCFHNSFIVFTARGLYDGVTCLFLLSAHSSFPSNRNFGSNVLSSLLSSTVWIFSLFIMPCFFDGQFMRSSRNTKKNSRWMNSTESLKLYRDFALKQSALDSRKKCSGRRKNSNSGQYLKVQEFNCLYYSIPG